MGVLTIVPQSKVQSWQNFTGDYYLSGRDPYVNSNDFLFPLFPPGTIWKVDRSTFPPSFSPDPNGYNPDSPYDVIVAISQYTISPLTGKNQVGYQVHNEPAVVESLDIVIDCVAAYQSDNPTNTFAPRSCGTISPATPVPLPTVENPNPTGGFLD